MRSVFIGWLSCLLLLAFIATADAGGCRNSRGSQLTIIQTTPIYQPPLALYAAPVQSYQLPVVAFPQVYAVPSFREVRFIDRRDQVRFRDGPVLRTTRRLGNAIRELGNPRP